jgi:hypothetical protein
MLPLLATMLAMTPPPTGFTVTIDRIPVKRGTAPASVMSDPMTGTLVLRGVELEGKPPRLCPRVSHKNGALELKCDTRRIWAALGRDARGSYVDLRELRGLTWDDAASRVPMRAWSMRAVAIPDACPGTTAAARGECALGRDELTVARAAWTEALDGPDLGLAHLRLGDLAVRDGDIEAALKHYSSVSLSGVVGRIAMARGCELLGSCLSAPSSQRVANADGLPAELARELHFHTLRRELGAGRDAHAMTFLLARLEADSGFCQGALLFCQKMLQAGLESSDTEARIGALSAFLTDKARHGPLEDALNEAASKAAVELGAPSFAAAILAANTPRVPKGALSDHLLEIITLYLSARDSVRANVVLEYADAKLGAFTQSPAWRSVRQQLGRKPPPPVAPSPAVDDAALEALSQDVSLSTDLARAAAVRSRATPLVDLPLENAP